jgi:parallel beta-helix repeat protein
MSRWSIGPFWSSFLGRSNSSHRPTPHDRSPLRFEALEPRRVLATLWVDQNVAPTPTIFSTITNAVVAAHSGDTIKVVAGTYPEHVTVDKPLTLIGGQMRTSGAPLGQSVLAGSTTAFTLQADGITIRNFVIQNATFGIQTAPGVVGYKILNNMFSDNIEGLLLGTVADGRAKASAIIGNEFDHVAALQLWDIFLSAGQNLIISHNTFQGRAAASIAFGSDRSANVRISNNQFFGDGGTFANATTNLKIDDNTFIDPSSAAIVLSATGEVFTHVTVEKSEVVGNKLVRLGSNSGGGSGGGGAPTVDGIVWDSGLSDYPAGNKISGNTIDGYQNGIVLNGLRQSVVSGNNVEHCTSDGVVASDCQDLTISANVLVDNAGNGIEVRNSAGKRLTQNTAIDNTLNGILLSHATRFIVSANKASHNAANGIEMSGDGDDATSEGDTLSQNELDDNALVGIAVSGASGNTLHSNACQFNGSDGIAITQSANDQLSGNTCKFNGPGDIAGGNGISLSDAHQNKLRGNVTRSNAGFGISLDHSSSNFVSGSAVDDNQAGGIDLMQSSTGNMFAANTVGSSVTVGFVAGPTSDDNVFTKNIVRNNSSGFIISANGNLLLSNTVSACHSFGIYVAGNSNVVKGNIITGTYGIGIQISGQMLTLSNNVIKDTHSTPGVVPGDIRGDGIRLFGVLSSTISGNIVMNNDADGIDVMSDCSSNTISGNTAMNNGPSLGGFDLLDRSSGSGTAGTANTWAGNKAKTRSPAGLL